MKSLREFVEEEVLCSFLHGESRAAIAQLISDFCIGLDMSTVLSDRFDAGYSIETRTRKLHVYEAYHIQYQDDTNDYADAEQQATISVDRSSIYKESDSRSTYRLSYESMRAEVELIEEGVRKWFHRLLDSKRVKGVDDPEHDSSNSACTPPRKTVVTAALDKHVVIAYNKYLPYVLERALALINHGTLDCCFVMPDLYFHGPNPKKMYCQLKAHCSNLEKQYNAAPNFHIWEKAELLFHVDRVTYSDRMNLDRSWHPPPLR